MTCPLCCVVLCSFGFDLMGLVYALLFLGNIQVAVRKAENRFCEVSQHFVIVFACVLSRLFLLAT